MLRSHVRLTTRLACATWRQQAFFTNFSWVLQPNDVGNGDTPKARRKTAKTTALHDDGNGNVAKVTNTSSANDQDAPTTINGGTTKPRKRRATTTTPLPPRLQVANAKHHDLASFLKYAADNKLDPTSTVHKGTLYEYTVAETLKSYGFNLTRVGRSNDQGIDLIGSWHLPQQTQSLPQGLPVIIQCKASTATPPMARELEGAYAGAPAGWNTVNTMALLVTTKESTAGVTNAVSRSTMPMGVMQITAEGSLKQFLWNTAAAKAGLGGLNVTRRYDRAQRETIALTWLGEIWPASKP